MSIWEYKNVAREPDIFSYKEKCPFCNETLLDLDHDQIKTKRDAMNFEKTKVAACRICGWPTAYVRLSDCDSYGDYYAEFRAFGSLKELDLTDISIPLTEIRDYLTANYSERFGIHPRKYEELVASVFKSFNYDITVTNYRGDDGIDIILENEDGFTGVQVKRYRNRIEAEQIRSLAGALVLKGYTKGIFVTTSQFRLGAKNTAERYKNRGVLIELIDAMHFFDALKIAQRDFYCTENKFDIDNLLSNLKKVREWTVWADGSSRPGVLGPSFKL